MGGEHVQSGLRVEINVGAEAGAGAGGAFAGEARPVVYSVHGGIAEHYKVDPAKLGESHAATIDYVISATAG